MKSPALKDGLFPPRLIDRLNSVAEVCDPEVLTDFHSARARAVLGQVDVLLTGWGCPRIDSDVLDAAPRLKLVAHAAGSVKSHVMPEVWSRGVTVTTAAQANAVPVAEYTLAMILLAGKRVLAQARELRTLRSLFIKESLDLRVGNLGNTVGIIGASRIGRLVLELLRPFRMRVLLSDPTLTPEEAAALGATLVPLPVLLASSDVVSLHAPVLPATIGMIGAGELGLMRDGATFINTARGVLVDHDALRAELLTGRITAVLDVTDPEPLPDADPLYALANVLLTPHVAGSQGNELARMGESAVTEVERLATRRAPAHPVSLEALQSMA